MVMLKIILNRLQPQAEEIIAEEQAGFRAGRSTTEPVFNLRILGVKYLQHQQNFYHVFIDFKKVFDRARSHLGKYEEIQHQRQHQRAFENLYDKAQSAVLFNGSTQHRRMVQWSIKNSGEVLNKLKSRGFRVTSLSAYDFSTHFTTLSHNLVKEKLINLIEWTLKREGSPYIACNERQAFFTSGDTKRYKLWSCQNVCEALLYLLDNIYIRFGTKLYRRTVGIPMGTNCAPLVADLFLFCYERDFMKSLSEEKQAEIIEAFKSTSRYLDDLLNIDNPYFEGMVNRIYPPGTAVKQS